MSKTVQLSDTQKKITKVFENLDIVREEDPLKDEIEKLKSKSFVDVNKDEEKKEKKENSFDANKSASKEIKDEKSIVDEINKALSIKTLSSIAEETKKISDATLRAIALKQSKATVGNLDDLILKTLDLLTAQSVDVMIDAFSVSIRENTEQSHVKRPNLEELYSEYTKILFISETIKTKQEVISKDDSILSFEELQKRYLSHSGILKVPIELYLRHINNLIEKDTINGKTIRGAEIYKDYLQNLGIINLFKEDFFNIF